MSELTENEKGYLQIAYNNGYRWIATDKDEDTNFYSEKPTKLGDFWSVNCDSIQIESIIDFGTSGYDEEPTSIADLLGVDDTDWDEVKPMTEVLVSDYKDKWEKAYFVGKNKFDDEEPYYVIEYDYMREIRRSIENCKNTAALFKLNVVLVTYKYCKLEETNNEN